MRKSKRAEARETYGFSCAWCGETIPDDVELFSVGAKAAPGVDLTGHEGAHLDIFLEAGGRAVRAIVVTGDSPAKRDGYDLLFVACGQRCASELRESIGREIVGLCCKNSRSAIIAPHDFSD